MYVQDVAKIKVIVSFFFRDFARCPESPIIDRPMNLVLLQLLDLQILSLYRTLSLSRSLQGVQAFFVGYSIVVI
jgi:hypothetical protein